ARDKSFGTGVPSWKPVHSSCVTLHHDEAVCQQFGETMSFWSKLDLDDVITNGIEDQLAYGMDAQFAHDIRPVGLYCFYAQIQNRGDLFSALPLSQKLHDFTLSRSHLGQGRLS